MKSEIEFWWNKITLTCLVRAACFIFLILLITSLLLSLLFADLLSFLILPNAGWNWRGELLDRGTHYYQRLVRQKSAITNAGRVLFCHSRGQVSNVNHYV